jgi:hypothetical protein
VKQLLYGIAAIGVSAISTPVWAQPAAGTTPPAAYSGPSPRGEISAERAAPSHHAYHPRHAAAHHGEGMRPGQSAAEVLNREEVSRLGRTSPTSVNRMPTGGRVISGGTSR